jgi:hypothetical protein
VITATEPWTLYSAVMLVFLACWESEKERSCVFIVEISNPFGVSICPGRDKGVCSATLGKAKKEAPSAIGRLF